jgi:hypothetical protein
VDDRDEFMVLVDVLGCKKRKIQDLLDADDLFDELKQELGDDREKKQSLASFRVFCKREMRSPQAVSPISPERLVPLDLSRLCSPWAVLLPVIGADEPEFCAEEGWLDSVIESVCKGMEQAETVHTRVCPMALVRCSRGGKTRALEEMAQILRRKRPDVAVVFVSFNNYSVIREWEHADPVAALCRRIAFAALNITEPTKHNYDRFALTDVTESDILRWLDDSSCVLLMDELNLLRMAQEQAQRLANFLKTHFLVDTGTLLCVFIPCIAF